MSTFIKLQIRLKNELGIDLFNFKRTRVGCWQKSLGAAVWIAQSSEHNIDYGSSYTATELLKCKKLCIYNNSAFIEILPND
jgi:hypothetical protein